PSAPAADPAKSTPLSLADRDFFEKKVRPLLAERCFSCHSAQVEKPKGRLRLDNKAGFHEGGNSGPPVDRGQPERSLLLQAIHYRDKDLRMPPSGKLAIQEIATLEEWVRRGAPYSDQVASTRPLDISAGRKFWSFRPPRYVPPPTTKDKTWAQRPMD